MQELLCGPITEESLRLAIAIAMGEEEGIEPCEHMLVISPESICSSWEFPFAEHNNFQYIGLVSRYQSVSLPGSGALLPCAVEGDDAAEVNRLFGILQEKINTFVSEAIVKAGFKSRYGGSSKDEVEKFGPTALGIR